MFSSGSLSLGRLFGIPFQLHWSVLVVAVLFGSGLASNYGTIGAAVALVAFLASITAHELAHALVARRHGVTRAAVSKRCVELTERLNLLPSRAMRSLTARHAYRAAQISTRMQYERFGHHHS